MQGRKPYPFKSRISVFKKTDILFLIGLLIFRTRITRIPRIFRCMQGRSPIPSNPEYPCSKKTDVLFLRPNCSLPSRTRITRIPRIFRRTQGRSPIPSNPNYPYSKKNRHLVFKIGLLFAFPNTDYTDTTDSATCKGEALSLQIPTIRVRETFVFNRVIRVLT